MDSKKTKNTEETKKLQVQQTQKKLIQALPLLKSM
jgi:hypothetical protein